MHSVPVVVVVEQAAAIAAAADLSVAIVVVAAVDIQQVRCNGKIRAVVAKLLFSSLRGDSKKIEKI